MLTFEEKLAIIESFPELERKDVSLGRVNFHYNESAYDVLNVVYHLHPNGNGFVYAGKLSGYDTNKKGLVNIRNFSEDELRTIVAEAIDSLTATEQDLHEEEIWINENTMTLRLVQEEDMWNVYTDDDRLDGTFNTYREAMNYLEEEGFSLI
ncbi:hypothetical protein [Desertibacillus haloalkaliphilus]|uniref:hypothetical protein n=1 Tax=Desertibacillus haloalkaliphilus TaxID=1328930 RepID=UPI001C25D22D|nr:hypothetical protein [Desertibacillus haloalkaliphilus]MBU8907637.1 hypothetical protein [Desertibacillus haloalkaliphilus]